MKPSMHPRLVAGLLAVLLSVPLAACGGEAGDAGAAAYKARISALEGQVVALEAMQKQQDGSNQMLLEYIKAQQATNTEVAAMLRRQGGTLAVQESSLDSLQEELASLRLAVEALVKRGAGK